MAYFFFCFFDFRTFVFCFILFFARPEFITRRKNVYAGLADETKKSLKQLSPDVHGMRFIGEKTENTRGQLLRVQRRVTGFRVALDGGPVRERRLQKRRRSRGDEPLRRSV